MDMLCYDTKGTLTQKITTIELQPPWCETFEQELLLFADLTTSEFVSRYTGYKPNNVWSGLKSTHTDVVGTFSFSFIWVVQCTTQAHMLCVIGSRSSVCVRDRTIHIPSMFAHERSSSFSRSHTTRDLTLFSSKTSTTSSTITSQVTLPINKPCAQDPQNEEYGSVAKTTSSAGKKPNVIDNLLPAETCTAIFQNESASTWTRNRRTRSMRNSTMNLSEKRYLHHCSLRSEKNQRTWDKLITLMKKVCYQLSHFSHTQERRDPCTNQVQICLKNGNQVATWKTSKSGFSLKGKKEQIPAEIRFEIQKHELQADSDRRGIQELTGIIDSQRMEVDHALTGCEQSRRDPLLLQEEMSEQNRALRETCIRNMRDMEQLQKFTC